LKDHSISEANVSAKPNIFSDACGLWMSRSTTVSPGVTFFGEKDTFRPQFHRQANRKEQFPMKRTVATAAFLTILTGSAYGQGLGEVAKKAAADRAQAPTQKIWTNADLLTTTGTLTVSGGGGGSSAEAAFAVSGRPRTVAEKTAVFEYCSGKPDLGKRMLELSSRRPYDQKEAQFILRKMHECAQLGMDRVEAARLHALIDTYDGIKGPLTPIGKYERDRLAGELAGIQAHWPGLK
jgi:hypothetical protein